MTTADEAIEFAKRNKVEISRQLTDPALYPPSEFPVTVFMAGSPGAGKTEYSKNMLTLIARNPKHHPVRIDSDDLRVKIPVYTGSNSSEVQGAVSILLRETYERTLKNRQTVIVDGTLANYEKARENIDRSLSRERKVFIFYVYQRPEIAWQFTLAREKVEGRNIPKDAFVDQFIRARETVARIHEEFKERVTIFLVKKDFPTNQVESVSPVYPNGPGLDTYLPETYTREQILELL